MASPIFYDYSFMMQETVGSAGSSFDALHTLSERLYTLRTQYFCSDTKLGFMELPYDSTTSQLVTSKAQAYTSSFSTLIVLGIGGSDLGARATIAALRSPYANFEHKKAGMRVFFLGGNTDPQEIDEIVQLVDFKETVINVISKSGDTVETMSTFIYLRDLLIAAVGYEEHKKHIIATTDAKNGTLRAIVEREGYDSLSIPSGVGGRFSVLSTVGLFPIACAGIDIGELLGGARDLCEDLIRFPNDALHKTELFAALHFLGLTEKKQNVHVFIPYAAHLREIGFWFRQLWAESLGKKDSLDGREVFVGPTPVAALGATDQHSQFQLYYQGPFDKIITFVQVQEFKTDSTIPGAFADIEGISYMKGKKFTDIINAELMGSVLALAERGRPSGRLIVPEISPYYIGQLFQFFEIATAYAGGLLHINTYDQPGVELGKQNAYALMGREGFSQRKEVLSELMKNANKHVA
jgi:glucose-6-phosphate isomerase